MPGLLSLPLSIFPWHRPPVLPPKRRKQKPGNVHAKPRGIAKRRAANKAARKARRRNRS